MTGAGVLQPLADLLIVSSLGLLVLRRTLWTIGLLAAQAIIVAVLAVVAAPTTEGWIGAAVIVVTKVVGIPAVLLWAARRTGSADTVDRSSPWVWLLGVGIVLLVHLALPTFTVGLNPRHATLLGTAILVMLLGLAGMVNGRLLLSQAIHLVVVENGLYCAGLALTGGLPAALELGTAIDLLLVVFVLAWLSHHVHRLQMPLQVDQLQRLRG